MKQASAARLFRTLLVLAIPLAMISTSMMGLTGCGPKPTATLPATVGEWTLAGSEVVADVPAVLTQLGHRSTKAYQYQGPVAIRVVAHEMNSETVAFEALQKWVAEPGTLPLQRKQFLLVPASNDKAALTRFTQALAAAF